MPIVLDKVKYRLVYLMRMNNKTMNMYRLSCEPSQMVMTEVYIDTVNKYLNKLWFMVYSGHGKNRHSEIKS